MASDKVKHDPDVYCLHSFKFEHCIYVVGILGAISQLIAVIVIVGHLATTLGIEDQALNNKGVVYSAVGITILLATSFSEVLLLRAVNQRMLPYIQWWMFTTFIVFLLSILLLVISGFTLYLHALWVTLSFFYLVIRLPFQMYFVDSFAHAEIMSKQAHHQHLYQSVLYRRFH